ncbi:Sulfate adenylyltransferase, small subunit [Croceitalea dokdonensis DOKDO 023]|uniref:Sulfate adenylyltransferase subunit 2 n=1 Tax=Croceitalea dokdonensis DOKDO 023 TaxID=1300341 RepID=A0A0P7AWN1_9FLAO|nr:Sulfate adenylyltransferase, small subunit [Croceitalea dokdonensis DOKDO 023]
MRRKGERKAKNLRNLSTTIQDTKRPDVTGQKNVLRVNALESEAIYIFREVVAQFEKPVLLFSGGKDSITLVRLAQKAFWPAKIPFPLMHIDTGHNFPETIAFRDKLVQELGVKLIVRNVQDAIDDGKVMEETGKYASRNSLQTTTLLDAIEEFRFDACIGGARRDEEKARAKERIFSVRDDFGQWDEKNQRPELFDMLNGNIEHGQNVRVFPISNWTELDVWSYIQEEQIEIPAIYFAHRRHTFLRDGLIWSAQDDVVFRSEDEKVEERTVRFRTVGDMSCTAAVESTADTIQKVVAEIRDSKISERGARIDDKRSEAAMEKRKQQGYF